MGSLILDFQHKVNPLHIYCRLLDKGFAPRISLRLSRCYEILIYKWLSPLTFFLIFFYRSVKKNKISKN
jgi:hypothetical protein